MKKRALAILLALCVCLSLPVAAWADDGGSTDLGHKHCVCGVAHQSVGGHTESEVDFTEWTSTTSLPGEPGNYYLAGDVTISEIWFPGDNTVLCLNGHTITMTSDSDVVGIRDNRNFTLTDCAAVQGKITHSSGKTGCGVSNNGMFNMYGGNICGNTAEYYGGGVFNFGTFNMHGGEIKGNTAGYQGGGVYDYGTMSVGGKVNITTNKVKLAEVMQESNVCVNASADLTLNSTPLTGEARIGVNIEAISYVLVKDVADNSGVSACFTSDFASYVVQVNDDGDLEIAPAEHCIALGSNLLIMDDYESADKTIKYDKATNTLTLNNATINGASMAYAGALAGMVVGNEELTLNLSGANTITVPKADNVATVEGIRANDLKLTGTGSLTVSTGNAASYNYGIVVGNLDVQDGVTLTVNAGTSNFATEGIYASQKLKIGAATVSVTAGKTAFMSYGIYSGRQIEIADNAVVTATAGATTGYMETITTSYGIMVEKEKANDGQLIIGKATVTATGGASNGEQYAYSYGMRAYSMTVADGAVVKAAGGAATSVGNAKMQYYTGDARSYGIEMNSDLSINAAEVTATGGNVTAWNAAYSYGIQCTEANINDGAEVSVVGGNVTATGEDSPYRGFAYSYGISAYVLDIAKAEMTATAGTATVLHQTVVVTKDEYAEPDEDPYNYYCSNVESVGVNISDLKLADGGKLTAKAGIATNRSGSQSGKYVDASSVGMYVYCNDDEDAAAINGTLVAIGGRAFGSNGVFTHDGDEYGDTVSKVLGGDVGSMGACVYGKVVIGRGANVQMSGAYAECSGSDGGWAHSNGCVVNGQFVMNDGSVYVSGGKAKGGKVTDSDAMSIRTDDLDGEFEMDGGWLKLVSNDIAIYAVNGIGWSDVDLIIPENGSTAQFTNDDDEPYYTIIEALDDDSNDDAKIATTVLFHDGKAAAVTPVAVDTTSGSGSGGGGHKKNDTTKDDEKKDENKEETKTDETKGDEQTTVAPGEATTENIGDVFNDTKGDDWYAGAATYAYNNGLMKGNDDGSFGANENATRGQVVTILHRLMDEPETTASTFTDIFGHEYYADAVAWAAANGVVLGYEDGTFKANVTVTREELVTILYRFAKAQGIDVTQGGMAVREFADWEQISDWAMPAMQWAVNTGLIKGDNGYLKPGAPCTRAEIATMLMRFNENIMK